MYVIKKDGRREAFDPNKIKSAVNKSAERVMVEVDDDTHKMISDYVAKLLQEEYENSEMKVENMTSAEVAEIRFSPIAQTHCKLLCKHYSIASV